MQCQCLLLSLLLRIGTFLPDYSLKTSRKKKITNTIFTSKNLQKMPNKSQLEINDTFACLTVYACVNFKLRNDYR